MTNDQGRANELLTVRALGTAVDKGRVQTNLHVAKFDLDQIAYTRCRLGLPPAFEPQGRHFALAGVRPAEVFEQHDCNLITNAGWVLLMDGIAGSSVTKYSASVGRIGTSPGGASPTTVTPAYSDTNLAYTSTDYWQLFSAAPTVGSGSGAGNGLSFTATFGTGNANWQWMEAAVDAGTASASDVSATATMLNHLGWSTSSYTGPGTKTSSQTWDVTLAIQWA